MKPFHIVFCYRWQGWTRIYNIENIVLMFLSFNAMPAKITKNIIVSAHW